MPWEAALTVWDAIADGWRRVRSASDRDAGARRRARRGGAAPHRRRFPQQPQGDDRGAEIFAVRARHGAARRSRARARSSAATRSPPSIAAAIAGRSSGSRSTGRRWKRSTKPSACRRPPRRGVARLRAGLQGRPPGRPRDDDRVVDDAEEVDRAGHDRSPALRDLATNVDLEVTVEAVRHTATATVVKTPFFNPPRKTATPPL